jgi:hypothetical protein
VPIPPSQLGNEWGMWGGWKIRDVRDPRATGIAEEWATNGRLDIHLVHGLCGGGIVGDGVPP